MKAEQGAHVAFSQPIFDPEVLTTFLDKIKDIDIKFMLGIIPLRTIRHAEFLALRSAGHDDPRVGCATRCAKLVLIKNEQQRSVSILRLTCYRQSAHKTDGVYLMPPFKKYDIAIRILRTYKRGGIMSG